MIHPVIPRGLAEPSGKVFPNGLVRGRLIDELSCAIGGVGETIREIIPR